MFFEYLLHPFCISSYVYAPWRFGQTKFSVLFCYIVLRFWKNQANYKLYLNIVLVPLYAMGQKTIAMDQ
jgi:ABC-type multidrug transport system permease subunit